MTRYVDSKIAAQRLGKPERYVCSMCKDGQLPGAIKNGSRWKIPSAAHPKLAETEGPENLINSDELSGVPADKRDQALRRLGIIQDFERFCGILFHEGQTRAEAIGLYAAGHDDITRRTLERWLARYRDQGLLGLVDMRGGGRFFGELISPDAFELFKAMYLTQQRLSVKTCWQNIHFVNKDRGKGWKVPALHFMYRYIKSRIPLGVQILHREGLAAYEAKCAPYVEIDPDSIEPGQVWVGDHSQFNCWIRHRGRWVRPWITCWEDMRSRLIVGYCISTSPNQTTILLAAKRGLEKYGPPDSAKIDNGRDYDSECWTGITKAKRRVLRAGYIDEQIVAGIYAMMGVGVSFAIKYHPQSKPIERLFDTLDCQFTKTVPTYCGKDSDRKPDYLNDLLKSEKAISEAYNLESFTEIAGQYIEVYNNSAHTGKGMEGRTPTEVFTSRSSRRVMTEGVLELLLRVWSGELTVGKNGVRFKNMWFGQYDMELAAHQGKKVRVSYDPDDLRRVYVYDAVTLKLITIAEQNELIRYGSQVGEEDLREAMHHKSRALRNIRDYRDSQLTANMDLTALTIKAMQEGRKKPDEKPQQAKMLRPVRTPLDGQVREHERQEILKEVKKAAGAESVEKVLDFDFSLFKPENKYEGVRLLDDE